MANEFIESFADGTILPPALSTTHGSVNLSIRRGSGRGSGKTYAMVWSAVGHQQMVGGGAVLIIARDEANMKHILKEWLSMDGRCLGGSFELERDTAGGYKVYLVGKREHVATITTAPIEYSVSGLLRPHSASSDFSAVFIDHSVIPGGGGSSF